MSVKSVKYTFFIILLVLTSVIFVYRKINSPRRLNVIWLLIDALRVDHLGCYGYERDTSPFIDEFADESILFNNAFSQESYTQASVPSYFTSTYPFVHKVLYDYPQADVLDSEFVTLAEILRDSDYNTAAFVFNPHLKARFNFGQGFDVYDDNQKGFDRSVPKHIGFETAKKIFNKVERYLKKSKKRPVFLYLHYRDVHTPYAPPPPYHKLFLPAGIEPVVDILDARGLVPSIGVYREHPYFEHIDLFVSQYDGEIRYTDDYIEKTMRMLEEYNINKQNSIIIITADHGEEFCNYHPEDPGGMTHARTLYGELIRVPLILSIPDMKTRKKTIDSYVELIDIAPTILDALGIPWKVYNQFQGRSLIPLIQGEECPPRTIHSGGNHSRGVIIEDGYKYYLYEKSTKGDQLKGRKPYRRPSDDYNYTFGEQLYDIVTDPLETINLIDQERAIASNLREKLHALKESAAARRPSPPVELDEVTVEQLISLGYLQ